MYLLFLLFLICVCVCIIFHIKNKKEERELLEIGCFVCKKPYKDKREAYQFYCDVCQKARLLAADKECEAINAASKPCWRDDCNGRQLPKIADKRECDQGHCLTDSQMIEMMLANELGWQLKYAKEKNE